MNLIKKLVHTLSPCNAKCCKTAAIDQPFCHVANYMHELWSVSSQDVPLFLRKKINLLNIFPEG